MYFLIDNERKIIFGWSAKCGCTHVKRIFWYLVTGIEPTRIHTEESKCKLPKDIGEYTTIIFCRNPYNRIVSGFLDKYKKNGELRHLWESDTITFKAFVDELVQLKWKQIEIHHFIKQTSEMFDKRLIAKSKTLKFFDITNIDYEYIGQLFGRKIPDNVIFMKKGHERIVQNNKLEKDVYDLDIDEYWHYDVELKYFYNEEIKKKVYAFYVHDFAYFNSNGLNYEV